MFLTLFSLGYTEMIALRVLPKKLKQLALDLKNLSRIDKLFIYRRLSISFFNWALSPFVLNRLMPEVAVSIMFCYITLMTFVFLKLTNHSTKESTLLKFVSRICRNKKVPKLLLLLISDPFLFAIDFKNNFCYKYKNLWILATLFCLVIAIIIWVIFVNLTGLKI
jgi:hypothetical protein